jgi:hypothetical protein
MAVVLNSGSKLFRSLVTISMSWGLVRIGTISTLARLHLYQSLKVLQFLLLLYLLHSLGKLCFLDSQFYLLQLLFQVLNEDLLLLDGTDELGVLTPRI